MATEFSLKEIAIILRMGAMQIKVAITRIKWIIMVDTEGLLAIFLSLKNSVIGKSAGEVIGQHDQNAAYY